MERTTVMADRHLIDQLRQIAKDEDLSLGEVIRQGLEWRAKTRRRVPSFIGRIKATGAPSDDARHDEELILEYVRQKHARH